MLESASVLGWESVITGRPSVQASYLLWPEQQKIKGNVEL